jgi:hypothetical protein
VRRRNFPTPDVAPIAERWDATVTVAVPVVVRSWCRRRPYIALFVFALAVRVTVATVIALFLPRLSFFDDGTYAQLARERVNGVSHGWDSYTAWLYVHTGTLEYPLTLLYRIFGPSRLSGPLFVTIFGALVAPLVARLLAHVVDRQRALVAGCIIALLPSQVLVSSVLTKDALTWSLLAGLALVVATAATSSSPRRVIGLALLSAGLLALLGLLRLHTMTVAAFALALTAGFGARATRSHRLAGFVSAAIVVPWVLGIGPLGLQLVANHGSLEGTRAYHASGGSAVPGIRPTQAPSSTSAGSTSAGARGAPGPGPDDGSAAARSLAYLPRGVSVVLLEPLPWRRGGSASFRLAAAEALLWYPLLILGLVGAAVAWRRRDVLGFPVLVAGALACMWALVDGNIGTAFRHRGEVVWAVVVLATYGFDVLQQSHRVRRAKQGVEPASFELSEVGRAQPAGPL